MKILVVDDEKLLVKGIKFNLENEGYTVEACYDGLTAVQMAAQGGYDLIILDLMMPGLDGLEACQRIRESSTVPIIMLTARSEDADKLLGFESGADDYITKPFNILELKARIRALLRRAGITASQPGSQSNRYTYSGGVTLDTEKRSARKHGAAVDLTAREFDLAELFWRSPGRVFSRDSLLDLVWGFDYQGDARTVDVHIRRLREKLEDDPAAPQAHHHQVGRRLLSRRVRGPGEKVRRKLTQSVQFKLALAFFALINGAPHPAQHLSHRGLEGHSLLGEGELAPGAGRRRRRLARRA